MATDVHPMTPPVKYIVRMLLFATAVVVGVALFWPRLSAAFFGNVILNSIIIGLTVVGSLYIIRQAWTLRNEVRWIEFLKERQVGITGTDLTDPTKVPKPRLLAPMAAMMGSNDGSRLSLSAVSLRTLLDGLHSRIEESQDLSRYLIGLLVFLGLLGTFWGLLITVDGIGAAIGGLTIAGDDPKGLFNDLRSGLEAPLGGMGTAFSSSLFGLAGSLFLGFFELQANQANGRFVNELEDWLSTITTLSGGDNGFESSDPFTSQLTDSILDQTSDSLDRLQRALYRGEESRVVTNNNIVAMTDKVGTLTERLYDDQALLQQVAQGQLDLQSLLSHLGQEIKELNKQIAESSSRDDLLRLSQDVRELNRDVGQNLSTAVATLDGQMAQGRKELVGELAGEIRQIDSTIKRVSEQAEE
ncbi:flagellar motor protein MotA [Alphaproteobacteria bacterium]|nr:flagellar motor protein MotA [Alphaproteobacteria bacterium]